MSFSPLRMTRNMGTRVPSFDLYQTCLVSYWLVSMPVSTESHSVLFADGMSKR